MSILQTKNLNYTYGANTPFEVKALDNINIEINKEDFVGIIGQTGSGKSTLIQLLNGLNKPTSGTVLLDGTDIFNERKNLRDVRFRVGMVFQYPEYQLFEENVYKDIAFGPSNMGLAETEINTRVHSSIKAVGLDESILDKSPFDLSGGEKRRVAIAGVIAMNPDVLILDEPTAGLDPNGKKVILDLIKKYHDDNHTTIILVSHSMEEVAQMANKVLVMYNSKVVMYDETQKIFMQDEKLTEVGLELPQITKIMKLLKNKGYPIEDAILTVDNATEVIKNLIFSKGVNMQS